MVRDDPPVGKRRHRPSDGWCRGRPHLPLWDDLRQPERSRRTWIGLTTEGRAALEGHVAALRRIAAEAGL